MTTPLIQDFSFLLLDGVGTLIRLSVDEASEDIVHTAVGLIAFVDDLREKKAATLMGSQIDNTPHESAGEWVVILLVLLHDRTNQSNHGNVFHIDRLSRFGCFARSRFDFFTDKGLDDS
jgi:hypothetical protein